jgi:DNA repair exonuclease SbcCD ATPase subunit
MAAPFRSELEAIRGRAEALEEQNEALRERLEKLERHEERPTGDGPKESAELAALAERTLERLEDLSEKIDAEAGPVPEAVALVVPAKPAPALEVEQYALEVDALASFTLAEQQKSRIASLEVRVHELERARPDAWRWVIAAFGAGIALGLLLGRLWH